MKGWRWQIASLWDGSTIPVGEHATVELVHAGDVLHLGITAPHHADPLPDAPAGSTPALWDFEVVELFLLGEDERYLEVEVGPGGHYLVLQLEGRRRVVAEGHALDLAVQRRAGTWRARASLPARWLPLGWCAANAYAIHGQGEARRYLAAAPVPGEGPDFHRLGAFPALEPAAEAFRAAPRGEWCVPREE